MSSFFTKIKLFILEMYRRVTKRWDITVPAPTTVRSDLLYGYYSTDDAQPAQVKGHTNLHWETQFQGMQGAVMHMKEMGCATLLDLASQCFEHSAGEGRMKITPFPLEVARSKLVMLFDLLKEHNVLRHVVGLVPLDEPNLHHATGEPFRQMVALVREVAAQYEELKNVKLVVIYTTAEPFNDMDLFDWLGFDDYRRRSSILEKDGTYDKFKKRLRPDQRTILMPGAYRAQNPTPFVNFAHSHPEVVAVIPFLWHSVDNEAENFQGLGYHEDAALREKYVQTGLTLTGRNWG